MKELDEYSQRFAKVLFEAFPEWENFLKIESADETDKGYLLVEIPAPTKGLLPIKLLPDNKDVLFIYSDGEITIGFDYYHTHRDNYADSDETESFRDAVELIQAILDEKVCSVVILSGEQWCGSTSTNAGEKPDLSHWKNISPDCDVYIRSWYGVYNQKYKAAEYLKTDPF